MDVLPKNNREYSTQSYWNHRYEQEKGTYDWFKEWPDLKDVLSKYIQREDNILNVGCGNSKLSEQMYDDGYHKITNVDFSSLVIDDMRSRCAHLQEMTWLEMDVKDMKFEDSSFDIVLDKGTMDALLCEQTSAWTVDDDLAAEIDKYLSEATRVLKPEGTFVYVTFGQPHFRKALLMKDKYSWSWHLETIGDGFHYFIYILKKGAKSQ